MAKLVLTEEERDTRLEEVEVRHGIFGCIFNDEKSSDQTEGLWSLLEDGLPAAVQKIHFEGSDQDVAVFSKEKLTPEQLQEWSDVFQAREPGDED